jgi:putative DNA primase/helicase
MTALEIAQQFLAALVDWSPVWTFQTFDDKDTKRKDLVSVRAGKIETHFIDLEQLNKDGAGVFVTVNLQTDPKKRNAKNTKCVTALFVDFDGAALPESWRLEPTIVLESSAARYHAYWTVDDMPLEEFEHAQKALAAIYDGDPKVCDLPRVMRIPGFMHMKGEPFQTRILSINKTLYTRAELQAAYPEIIMPVNTPATRATTKTTATRSTGKSYGLAALEAECALVHAAREGSRNDQLNKSAFALGQLIAGGELEEHIAVQDLESSGIFAGLPQAEVRQTVAHGIRDGKLEPRTAPPSEYAPNARAGIKHNPSDPVTSNQPTAPAPKKKTRGLGFTDYRDEYLEHLTQTDTRVAHLEKNNSWWCYENGVYKPVQTETMMRWVDTALEEHDLSESILKNVLAKLARVEGIHREADELQHHQLNCANGILNLHTLELRDHTPDFFSTVQTHALWNPDADCPEFRTFLEFAVPKERDRWVIQQYFGYCLTGLTKYQTALFLIGEGGTGKGTLARILRALLGGENHNSYSVGVSFEALSDGNHHMTELVGRRLAVISEMNRRLDWQTFKRITGEDAVLIDEKYKTTYSTRLMCKLLLLANTMPYLGEDATNASIIRRLLIIEMNQRPSELDNTLEGRLVAANELSGVLRWAVAGLRSLEAGNGFHVPQNELNREMVEQSNRVITWLEENCYEAHGLEIAAGDLFANYVEWCRTTNHHAVSSTRFKPDVMAAAKHLGWKPLEHKRTASARSYVGLALHRRLL